MSVIEEVAEIRAQRKRAAETRADELARKEAAGKKVDPVEVIDAMAAAGLPDEWYDKRMEHHKTRPGQLAIVAQQPEAERAKAQAQAELAEAEAELKAAQQHFADRWNPAQQALELANRQLEQIGQVRGQLQATCKDPAIVNRLAEIGPEIAHLQDEARGLEHRKAGAQRELARLEPQLAEHEARKNQHAPRPGNPAVRPGQRDPATSWVPSAYDPQEHAKVQAAVTKAQGELPVIESALAAIPGKIAA